jgi:dTDP-4-dehydrorhamnose reductase
VEALLVTVAPRAVINVTSGGADWAITADGSIHIAMATAKLGIRLVHVSSDAVFSGIGKARYDETCTPDPITPRTGPRRPPLRPLCDCCARTALSSAPP